MAENNENADAGVVKRRVGGGFAAMGKQEGRGLMFVRATISWVSGALLALAALQAANAQDLSVDADLSVVDEATAPDTEWRYMVGIGVAAVPDYEGSEDYEAAPVPLARIQRGEIYAKLTGLKLSTNLVPHPNFRLGPVLNVRGERDKVDNDRVDDMRDIDTALEAGVVGGYDLELDRAVLSLEVEWLVDVSDEHEGWLLIPRVKYVRSLSDSFTLLASTSLTVASEDYMETYFGVSGADSVKSGLSPFDADEGVKDWSLALGGVYNVTDSWGVGAFALYKVLLEDAADSPVVDDVGDENQLIGGIFTTYKF
jgi:outer membrane protein